MNKGTYQPEEAKRKKVKSAWSVYGSFHRFLLPPYRILLFLWSILLCFRPFACNLFYFLPNFPSFFIFFCFLLFLSFTIKSSKAIWFPNFFFLSSRSLLFSIPNFFFRFSSVSLSSEFEAKPNLLFLFSISYFETTFPPPNFSLLLWITFWSSLPDDANFCLRRFTSSASVKGALITTGYCFTYFFAY